MKLLRDLILIKVDQPEQKTKSGFHVPTKDREGWETLPPTGVVQAVGPDVNEVEVGQHVMFERYGSIMLDKNLETGGRMCRESQVFAVLDDEA